MQELIKDLCKQLRLGAHIAERYDDIQATSNEEFLYKIGSI